MPKTDTKADMPPDPHKITLIMWAAYYDAGAPYGRTLDGLIRWLTEQAHNHPNDQNDPRIQRPL